MRHSRLLSLIILMHILSAPAYAAELRIRAGIIVGSGDVKPVARTFIYVFPYNPDMRSLYEETAIKKKLGSPPVERKYRKKVSLDHGDRIRVYTDPAFAKDYNAWVRKVKPHVDKLLAQGESLKQNSRSDLGGNVVFRVKPGEYFIFATYTNAFSQIQWNVPVRVSGNTYFELSNDNGYKPGLGDFFTHLLPVPPSARVSPDETSLTPQGEQRLISPPLSIIPELSEIKFGDPISRVISALSEAAFQYEGDVPPHGHKFKGVIESIGECAIYVRASKDGAEEIVIVSPVVDLDLYSHFSKTIEVVKGIANNNSNSRVASRPVTFKAVYGNSNEIDLVELNKFEGRGIFINKISSDTNSGSCSVFHSFNTNDGIGIAISTDYFGGSTIIRFKRERFTK